jgi:hypothetical protein
MLARQAPVMRRIAVALALGLAPMGGALAQEASPPSRDATPEQIERAHARAQQLIDAAQAGDLFLAEADERMPRFPRVRHRRSGLVCTFSPDDTSAQVVLFPSGHPRGDDVGCSQRTMFEVQSAYATRAGPGETAAAGLAGAIQAMRLTFTNLRPYSAPKDGDPLASLLPMPEVGAARASFVTDQAYTHVSVAIIGGWTIKLRLTGPANLARILDGRADMVWRMLTTDVLAAQAADPEGAL